MSFSSKTKNELARINTTKNCCAKAELAAVLKMDGSLSISGQKIGLTVTTENAAVARKVFSLIKKLLDISTELVVRRKSRLKKNNSYLIKIPSYKDVYKILSEVGLLDSENQINFEAKPDFLKKECCRRAYLRGVFLGGGSVNDPEGNYHLEIITNNESQADFICELLNLYDLSAKISNRKNWFVVYLKESENIVKLLNITGAHSALLNYENVRIYKEMRNQVNRIVNCETANLNKTVNAALNQIENIDKIKRTIGIDKLPKGLQQVAELRLHYPDVSLKELGEMLDPAVGKSGVNHRMRKIEKIASSLCEHGGKKN